MHTGVSEPAGRDELTPAVQPDSEGETGSRERLPRDLIRLLSAFLVFGASAAGLVTHFFPRATETSGPAVVATAIPANFVFGDLHMPQPKALANNGKLLCVAEVRRSPQDGAWLCVNWQDLDSSDVPSAAGSPGGPCTERVVNQRTGWWECTHRTSFATYADPGTPPKDGSDHGAYGGCLEERRPRLTAPWSCTIWNDFPEWLPVRVPRSDAKPCIFRRANQDTGRWDCLRRSADELVPTTAPRTAYRGIA